MSITIHFKIDGRTVDLEFDESKSLNELIEHIKHSFLEPERYIAVLTEWCAASYRIKNPEDSLDYLDFYDGIEFNIYSLDHNLLVELNQEKLDIETIRKLLAEIKCIKLSAEKYTNKTLNILQIAMRGNRTITEVVWEGTNSELNPQRKKEIIALADSNRERVKYEARYQAQDIYTSFPCLMGSDSKNKKTKTLPNITVEKPHISDEDNTTFFLFQSYNTCSNLLYKLRIAVDFKIYHRTKNQLVAVVCELNKKYAQDPYNSPLQHAKATLFTEKSVEDDEITTYIQIWKILISKEQDRLAKVKALIEKSKITESERNKLYRKISTPVEEGHPLYIEQQKEYVAELHADEAVLQSIQRMAHETQITLYPMSDTNWQDIRLLFFIRDTEIELKRRNIPPCAGIAMTDTRIGAYVNFRQQLATSGEYIAFDHKHAKNLSRSQQESPHYQFLANKNYPENYNKIWDDKNKLLPKKMVNALEYYFVHCEIKSENSPEITLTKKLQKKIIVKPLFSGFQLLQEIDHLLLTLYDGFHPISPALLQLSFAIEDYFKKEREALVAASFSVFSDEYIEEFRHTHPEFQKKYDQRFGLVESSPLTLFANRKISVFPNSQKNSAGVESDRDIQIS